MGHTHTLRPAQHSPTHKTRQKQKARLKRSLHPSADEWNLDYSPGQVESVVDEAGSVSNGDGLRDRRSEWEPGSEREQETYCSCNRTAVTSKWLITKRILVKNIWWREQEVPDIRKSDMKATKQDSRWVFFFKDSASGPKTPRATTGQLGFCQLYSVLFYNSAVFISLTPTWWFSWSCWISSFQFWRS